MLYKHPIRKRGKWSARRLKRRLKAIGNNIGDCLKIAAGGGIVFSALTRRFEDIEAIVVTVIVLVSAIIIKEMTND